MLFSSRSFVVLAVLASAATLPAQAQRGLGAPRRPAYGYFRYRIARPELGLAWRGDLRLRSMERARAAMERVRVRMPELENRLRDRSFELRDRMRLNRFDFENRLRDRRFDLEDRAFRRQLENQDRALLRLRERQDRGFLSRPFLFPRRSRPI